MANHSPPGSLKQIEVQHQRRWNSLEWDNLFAEQPQPPVRISSLNSPNVQFYTLHFVSFTLFLSLSLSLSQAPTMMAWTAAARQAAHIVRISSPKSSLPSTQASSLIHRRGLAGGSDHHGPPKVNFWEDPMSPSKWKEEHFVIVSLTGWGLLFYGGYEFFTKGNDKKEEKIGEDSH